MSKDVQKVEDVQPSSTPQRITSDEEQGWWDALYMYVKNDILELDPKLNLNHYTVMRLKGMAQGCFIGQNRTECQLTYGYRTILAAFYKMAPLIKYGFHNKTFNSLQHKVNWMMSVVEPHLNEAYIDEESDRKRIEDMQSQTETVDDDVARYQKLNNYLNQDVEFKTAKTWDKQHEDMW